jgi:putative N6-adenine-specific DNA methylase
MSSLELFASSPPGVSGITARELEAIGIAGSEVLPDGVVFPGDEAVVQRANLWLRTANRVVVRMGTFRARTFAELERHAAGLDWRLFVQAGGAASFRVTARKCRLYHTAAIAERLANAAGVRNAGVTEGRVADDGSDGAASGDKDPAADESQLFVVRGLRDEWQLSADSSGAHLHQRGYRLATGKAPLRETLAAAVVIASGWDRASPLVDPFCGAGTICIEAALLATERAPGAERDFRFRRWPSYAAVQQPKRWDPGAHQAGESPTIHGYDRDAGAVEAASSNSERAGLAGSIVLRQQSLSAFEAPAARGWIVTNPPYGVRVGDRGALRDLYARFGSVVRERCSGWVVAFLSADPALERATGLRLKPMLRTDNGGLPVRLMVAEL